MNKNVKKILSEAQLLNQVLNNVTIFKNKCDLSNSTTSHQVHGTPIKWNLDQKQQK